MSVKLTLSIDEGVIRRAKKFAKQSNRSLSEMVESYLARITDDKIDDSDDELMKVLGVIQLPDDFNEKDEIRKIMASKYMK